MKRVWYIFFFFFSSRRRHTRFDCDWSSDVCSSDLKKVPASTNDAYCPTLRGAVKSALDPDIAAVLEIVIDGLTPAAVAAAMRAAIAAVVRLGPKRGVARIGAGNYGGKLGPHHFH